MIQIMTIQQNNDACGFTVSTEDILKCVYAEFGATSIESPRLRHDLILLAK